MADLNYARVKGYWNAARPSILGPYMMDGFGFPASAGQFRFFAECRIVRRLIRGANHDGVVLDLGSGVGYWTEYFAQHFVRVVAVEGSRPLYEALVERCAPYLNAKFIFGDVMSFEPEDRYELVFLGGLLMYLNESDVIRLLRKLVASLRPGGVIVCRETTVRQGVVMREGDYQAAYRSVVSYRRIFGQCGLSLSHVELNVPYVQLQMGCEVIKRWKAIVPKLLQFIPVVGRTVYWPLRLAYPWLTRVAGASGLAFPQLTNHFFVLRPERTHGPTVHPVPSQPEVPSGIQS